MPAGAERGGPRRRAVVFLRAAARARAAALAAIATAAVAAVVASPALAAQRVPPSGKIQAVPARPGPAPFQPLPRPFAWPLRTTHPAALAAGKARLDAHWRTARAPGTAPRRSSSTGNGARTVQPAGLNQTGLSDASGSPPDTTGAIGPSDYVEFVNSKVRVFDRNTLAFASPEVTLGQFANDSDDICDPQIEWDPESNRWYYVALFNCTGASSGQHLDFGWSKTADPTDLSGTGWCRFQFNTAAVEDYPKLGHDDTHLIIGTNAFDTTTGSSLGAHLFVAPKPADGVTTCTMPTVTTFGNTAQSRLVGSDGSSDVNTPVPANTADASSVGYVVAADDATTGAKSHLVVWQVGGSASSPTLTRLGAIAVTPYTFPANVPQPATGAVLDSLDARLTQAVAHADPSAGGAEAVWTQHAIANPGGDGRALVRWYEVLPASLTLHQSGTIDTGSTFAFNAAISPTSSGSSAVVDYNVGSGSQLVDIRAQSRNAQMAPGAMGGELVIGTSSAADVDFTCPSPCRWGDYAGATPDPADTNTVWGSNQFNGPANGGTPAWGTRNFAIRASVPPTASFTIDRPTPLTGDPVTFTSTATDPDGPVAAEAWDLGSGNFTDASGPTATHAFARPGTYTVRLRVTDSEGTSSDAAQTVIVGDRPPVPRFTITPNPLRARRTTRFSAASSSDPDGTIVRYEWDLDGNGSFERSGTSVSVRRRYTKPRTVHVRLRVTDDSGVSAVTTRNLRVLDPNTVTATAANGLTASLRVAATRLRTVLARGLTVRVTSSRAGRARITMRLARTTARALGLSTTIVRRSVRFRKASRRTLHLRPRRATRARLAAGHRSLRVAIATTITDRRGGRVRLSRRVLLRR